MPTPKKSPELHALMGTKSQALIPEEPSFAAGRPKMPSDLPPLAVAEWARLCPKLNKRKTLTKADASALEIYCRIYSRWRKVESLAEESPLETTSWTDGDGVTRTRTEESAASKIAAKLEGQLRAYLTQFSATPASRCRTKPPKEPPTVEPLPTRDETALPQEPETDLDADDLQKAMAAL